MRTRSPSAVVDGFAPVATRVLRCGDDRHQVRRRRDEFLRAVRRRVPRSTRNASSSSVAEAVHVAGARFGAQQRLDAREELQRSGIPRAQPRRQRHHDLGRHRLAEVRLDHAQRADHERLLAEAEVAGVVQPLHACGEQREAAEACDQHEARIAPDGAAHRREDLVGQCPRASARRAASQSQTQQRG